MSTNPSEIRAGRFRPSLRTRIGTLTHVITALLHYNDATMQQALRYDMLLQGATHYRTRHARLYLYDDTHRQPRLTFGLRPTRQTPPPTALTTFLQPRPKTM